MVEVVTPAYVGVDWALEKHNVCVMRADGEVLREYVIEHTPKALGEFCDYLRGFGAGPDAVKVAIEVPHGPVVEALLERGFSVFSINPKQLDRFRDRFSVAGAKDDRLDARVLATSLLTDGPRFRRVVPNAPEVVVLREWSRMQRELSGEVTRLSNQVRQQLRRFYQQLLEVGDVTEPWVLELWQKAPTPEKGRRLGQNVIERLLKKFRIRRLDAATVHDRLAQPSLVVAAGTSEAATAHLRQLVCRLQMALQQQLECEKKLGELVDAMVGDDSPGEESEQHDVAILRSFPGLGRLIIAVLLAEASLPLANRDYHALRVLSGQAPVTRRSGKQLSVIRRKACDGRLRDALYHWSRVASQYDDHWRQAYAALRRRGHTHGRALRTIGDRLLRVLCAALRAGTLYDSARLRSSAADRAA